MVLSDIQPYFDNFLQLLQKTILCVPRYCFQYLIDFLNQSVSFMYSLFPAIDLQSAINSLQPISYFMSPFRFDYGFSVVIGAYIARFLIRRLPFIG